MSRVDQIVHMLEREDSCGCVNPYPTQGSSLEFSYSGKDNGTFYSDPFHMKLPNVLFSILFLHLTLEHLILLNDCIYVDRIVINLQYII